MAGQVDAQAGGIVTPSIARLAGRTLLWLPLCFAVWYFSAPYHAAIVGEVLQFTVNASFPVKVPMVRNGASLNLILQVPAAMSSRGGEGAMQASITLDILIYSCGIPLFMALMLGTPGWLRRWPALLRGLGVLIVYELIALFVSTCYNALNFLHVIGADTRWLLGLPWSPHLNLLAQTTFALVLPSAMAIFLWAAFNGDFIASEVKPVED